MSRTWPSWRRDGQLRFGPRGQGSPGAGSPGAGRSRAGESGVALVELTLVLPVFLFLLLIALEFGLAFKDELTLSQATREGARTGSGLAAAGVANCSGGLDPENVDAQIIAAVQGVLDSPGSAVDLDDVSTIRIYKSDSSGDQVGTYANAWRYVAGAGPDMDPGAGVDILDFVPDGAGGWPACLRVNSGTPDSLGVHIEYTYRLKTPLAAFSQFLGGSQGVTITMPNHTVMALNPSS